MSRSPVGGPAPLSTEEREVMEHTTAWGHKSRLFRNHFTTGPETVDWPIIQGLCARGLMALTRSPDPQLGGMCVFKVTDAGIAALTDPAQCDHGSEHAGRVEFEWCNNCDPIRARILEATGVDPGRSPLKPGPPTDGRTSSEGG